MKKTKSIPKVGDKIYVPTQLYLSRGEDDTDGGLATISKVQVSKQLPKGHMNSIFISVKEISGHSWNWNYIKENQKEWSKEYKGQMAKSNPDNHPDSNRWD